MKEPRRVGQPLIMIAILLLIAFQGISVSSGTQQNQVTLSTPESIKTEFDSVPCKDEDRLNAVQTLFERMGAAPSEISLEKHKNVVNVVVRKQGSSPEIIVIGAHYDKVTEGCGALDNWTGIVTVAHLYKSLRNVLLQKTILFVAFGREEKGLIGSHAMVEAIKNEQVAQYCEMINFDSLGLALPQVADNMSSKKLTSFAADIAGELKIGFGHAAIEGADADSNSFINKRIPAVTIHGMTNEWPTILHSRNDQPARVNPISVYLGYRLGLAMVTRLDSSSCSAYR